MVGVGDARGGVGGCTRELLSERREANGTAWTGHPRLPLDRHTGRQPALTTQASPSHGPFARLRLTVHSLLEPAAAMTYTAASLPLLATISNPTTRADGHPAGAAHEGLQGKGGPRLSCTAPSGEAARIVANRWPLTPSQVEPWIGPPICMRSSRASPLLPPLLGVPDGHAAGISPSLTQVLLQAPGDRTAETPQGEPPSDPPGVGTALPLKRVLGEVPGP
jgi:hypothetical protein